MIPPHGNDLVELDLGENRTDELLDEFDSYPEVELDRNLFYDFVNIARGVYSPLDGFISRNDFLKVLNDLTLESGVTWPLPIVLDVGAEKADEIHPGDRLGISTPSGEPAGVMDVDEVYRYNENKACQRIFGTTDTDHPGVRMFKQKGSFFIGGKIKMFHGVETTSSNHALSPAESRVLFEHYGWEDVAGFQTRNVPHRAHEYIQKSTLEHTDGIFIQPKIGEKKVGDYTNETILSAYEKLVSEYYPDETVVLSMFSSRMWYAGPREAVFDSIVRKNHGCTRFIIGRDHAGVGNYYGDFEAQEIFEEIGEIGIEPIYYHYAFYCKKCTGIVSEKVCPHPQEELVEPSGTKIRGMLKDGEKPPTEIMRDEVSQKVLSMEDIFVE